MRYLVRVYTKRIANCSFPSGGVKYSSETWRSSLSIRNTVRWTTDFPTDFSLTTP